MYMDIYWMGPIDPDTGLPTEGGGRYRQLKNLNFAPQVDLTGNTMPINEYTVDVITTDDIPVDVITCTLYDDRDLPWAYWPISKVQRLAPNCVRVTAQSWLGKLEHVELEAVMYQNTPATSAIAACFGSNTQDYSVNAAIAAKTVSGYAPAQTARERLTWLLFVLNAFPVDTFREDVRITGVDETANLIPIDRTFMRPTVDADKWVTGLKITTYTFREGTQTEWESDENSFQFPIPWIAELGTVTLANPDVPEGVPANVVEVDNIYLINPGNVSEVATRLAKYWFNPVIVKLDCVNNRKYRPGYLVNVYTGLDSMIAGYIQQETFKFGMQARSTMKLIGATVLPDALLTVNYTYNGQIIGHDEYYFPVGAEFSVPNPKSIEIADGDTKTLYAPVNAESTGTMPLNGMTINAEYKVEATLHDGNVYVLLTWGVEPADLDSHMVGPGAGEEERFHVTYNNKTYSIDGNLAVSLDGDVTHSYGPETTTIFILTPGTYYFYVHDYTNKSRPDSSAMSASGAVVRVYDGTEILARYTIDENRVGIVWNVCEIDIDVLQNVTVKAINSYTDKFIYT